MKEISKSLKLLFLFGIIVSFFSPFFVINNSYTSYLNILQNNPNAFLALLLLPFLLIFVSFFLDFCHVQFRHKDLIGFSSLAIGSILVIFSKYFVRLCFQTQLKIEFSYGSIVFFIACLCYLIYYSNKIFSETSLSIKDIVEISIFVCFAVIFDFPMFKIKIGASGGSISLAMLPLLIVSIRKGFLKGFFACGIVFALLTCLLDGYGFAFFPFDYLLGFGSLAIVGLFRKQILAKSNTKAIAYVVIGTILALIGRTIFATISGIIYYKMNFWSSLIYQLSYIGPSGAICVVLLVVLLQPLRKLTKY